jgi:hypothetical protein
VLIVSIDFVAHFGASEILTVFEIAFFTWFDFNMILILNYFVIIDYANITYKKHIKQIYF